MPTVRNNARRAYFNGRRWVRAARAGLRQRWRFARADVILVSYPKSGRTWLRVMLGRALQDHLGLAADEVLDLERLHDLDRRIPRILVTHDDGPHRKLPEEVERDKGHYRGKRVLLLVRDPRDVVVSAYFEASRRRRTFDGSLGEFVVAPLGGVDTIVAFYRAWARAAGGLPHLHVVRYEDLVDDPPGQLRRVLSFLGFDDVSDDVIADAVRFGSFDNMRRLEQEAAVDSPRLRPGSEDPESLKVRRGKVGGFRDYLDEAQIALVEDRVSLLDGAFGYGGSRTVSGRFTAR